MEFYIFENAQWNQVYVEIEPKLVKAKDTTNDSFSCVLKANTQEAPYKPMTPFKITYDDETSQILWIINDSVTVFSLKPLSYKHSLNIVQYRYFLNKHLVRNTVFNQPRLKKQSLYMATTNRLVYKIADDDAHYEIFSFDSNKNKPKVWYDTARVNGHSKIKSSKIKVDIYAIIRNYAGMGKITQKLEKIETIDVLNSYGCSLKDDEVTIDVLADGTSIFSFDPLDYFQNEAISEQLISACNQYLRAHQNTIFSLQYKVNGASTGSLEDLAFATSDINVSLTDKTTSIWRITMQANIEFELYNYTMLDVLDTLLKQYRLYDSTFHSKRYSLFLMPEENTDGLYELLDTTYPPDTLSFTQATWFEVLTEIFRFYDAEFWFDENRRLRINYYNSRENDKSSVKMSGKTLNFSDKDYNNGKVAFYQNATMPIKIEQIPTRANALGVPQKSSYAIVLPKPIYDIEKLSIYVSGDFRLFDTDSSSTMTKVKFNLDLTHFVLNREVWSVLEKDIDAFGSNKNYLAQRNTLPFVRGSNEINVSTYYNTWFNIQNAVLHDVLLAATWRFFGLNTNYGGDVEFNVKSIAEYYDTDWAIQRFYIEYLTNNNGRFQLETFDNKYSGEEIVNQNDGFVDLSKMGLNILGESLKNGVPTLTATIEMSEWDDVIKEGDYILYNNEYWVANVINYQVVKDGIYQVSVEFSKNFNALSLRTRTDKEKRLTNISREQAVLSEDNYIDYIYVSDIAHSPARHSIVLNENLLESFIGQTFGLDKSNFEYENVVCACVSTYDSNGILNTSGESNTADNLNIPLVVYGAGNCVCFEMQYDDPINAGNQLKYSDSVIIPGLWENTHYFSQATPYTDDDGWAEKITIEFLSKNDNYSRFPQTNYPKIDRTSLDGQLFNVAGKLDKLQYYKKPNEIFALNYEWCFLPILSEINDFFIGSAFIKNNAFSNTHELKSKKFYLRYSMGHITQKYNILDQKGKGWKAEVTVSVTKATNYVLLNIFYDDPHDLSLYADAWALVDENDDIYFASNHSKYFTNSYDTTTSIYFATKRTRMVVNENLDSMIKPALPTTVTFAVQPADWLVIPAFSNLAVTFTPSGDPGEAGVSYILEDDMSTTLAYSGSVQVLALQGKTMDYLAISQDTNGSHTPSVSFNSSTGTFSYTIYKTNYQVGDSVDAIISYATTTQEPEIKYNFRVAVPELVGQELDNIHISPAGYPAHPNINTISFNSNRGEFTGMVYQETEPNDTVNYTITFEIV